MNTYDSELHNKRKAIKYMRNNIEYHVDPLTGEVNVTSLAEDAWDELHPDPNDVIPDESIFFEWAASVAEAHERATGIFLLFGSVLGGIINRYSSDYF